MEFEWVLFFFSLLCFALSYSSVQCRDLGQSASRSHLTRVILVIAARWVRKVWTKVSQACGWMEKRLWPGAPSLSSSPACLSSSEHLALASTSVNQCRASFSPVFCPFLCSVLRAWSRAPPPPRKTPWTQCCLRRSLSSQAILYSVSPVSAEGSDHVSLLSTQLPRSSTI